ncbi:nucleotide exchange factor GrpE [Halorubellus salinus]|uniref:nucleotide exchange factor GrpE n=1 Tax=Halorubellus salinus TaxID=755309 RepID=UPI001D087457|nr:nucleotide exchange factor GrpE [Halorubellus salinus]
MADDYEGGQEGSENDEQDTQSSRSDSQPRGRTIPSDQGDGSDQENGDPAVSGDGPVENAQTGNESEQSESPDGPGEVDSSEKGQQTAAGSDESAVTESDGQRTHADMEPEAEDGEDSDDDTEVEDLREALSQTQNRITKLETELEDYERRNEHEHEELRKYTVEELASNMLRVKDMLGDSIEMESLEPDTEERLRMVKKQFDKVLTSGRIERIEPEESDEFDDRLHRMMEKVSTSEYESEQITKVLEVGYKTNDRVIRPARVAVAK